MIVGLATPTLVDGDAVGNDVMGMFKALEFNGYQAKLYAERFDRHLPVRPVSSFDGEVDAFILHHSINFSPGIDILRRAEFPCAVKYHNITPPDFFPKHSNIRKECELGLEQNEEVVKHTVWVDSDYNAQSLFPYKNDLDYTVIPPFTQAEDLMKVEPDYHSALQYDDWNTNILMVGRVAVNKNVLVGVQAFGEYLQDYPKSRLIVVGDYSGDYGQMVAKEGKKYGDRFVMTGKVSLGTLKSFYLLADALLITSQHEGFCVPMVEAMSLNVPVVTADCCALPETAGDAALVVKQSNPEAFASGLSAAVGNTDLVRRGRERYRSTFHRSKVVSGFLSALTTMVRK